MFRYGWKLTLVVLATAPLVGFANAMQMSTLKVKKIHYKKFHLVNESQRIPFKKNSSFTKFTQNLGIH
jgi:ABC-type bacteriocin/lantibiotic exporter with double-glycine peptidase domain